MGPLPRSCLVAMSCLAGIACSVFLFGPPQIFATYTGANDFSGFYTAGVTALSEDLYDVRGFMQAQARATGWMSDQLLFVRLPWQALFFSVFTLFPFPAARVIFSAVCVLALAAFAACW